MSEWILDETGAIPVELVLDRLQNFRARSDGALDYVVDIGDVQIQAHRTRSDAGGTGVPLAHHRVVEGEPIYVKDVERGLRFYRDLMGFKLIEAFRYQGTPVYARLRAPGGDGTIALHQAGPGVSVSSDGVRLYFEVRDLDELLPQAPAKELLHHPITPHDALGLATRLSQ